MLIARGHRSELVAPDSMTMSKRLLPSAKWSGSANAPSRTQTPSIPAATWWSNAKAFQASAPLTVSGQTSCTADPTVRAREVPTSIRALEAAAQHPPAAVQ